jgi:hypothetical protein
LSIKTFFLSAIILFFISGNQEALSSKCKDQLPFQDSLSRRAADSLWALGKSYLFDFTGAKPTNGAWGGYFLSIDPSITGNIILHLNVDESKKNISGVCNISYSHFRVMECTFEELRIRDSIRALKDSKLFAKYLNKQYEADTAYWAKYNELYTIKGHVNGDSLFFQIDTIYPQTMRDQNKQGRHFRFQGKCMKYFDLTSYERPKYFIIGNYIDSAFQFFPAFGSFILKKERK